MTRRETRRESRSLARLPGDGGVGLVPDAKETEARPPTTVTEKPSPLPLSTSFDGPGVPYTHRFATVQNGPVGVVTLNGEVAAELVCWEFFYGRECDLDGKGREERTSVYHANVVETEAMSKSSMSPSPTPHPACKKCHSIGTADDSCRGRVREALGQVKPKRGLKARLGDSTAFRVCRYGDCVRRHPSDSEVKGWIAKWWVESGGGNRIEPATTGLLEPRLTTSPAPCAAASSIKTVWSVRGAGLTNFRGKDDSEKATLTSVAKAREETENSSSSSSEQIEKEQGLHSLLVRRVTGRLREQAKTSPYVAAFLQEPFFEQVTQNKRLVRLLSQKNAHKEITEAYGARFKIAETILGISRGDTGGNVGTTLTCTGDGRIGDGKDSFGDPGNTAERATGAGLTIFDACSGRGVVGALLSFFFPIAQIVLMDANGDMNLEHVASRSNVTFKHVDLFGDSAVVAIKEQVESERVMDDEARETDEGTIEETDEGTRWNDNEFLTRDANKNDKPKPRIRVLLGVHLCGALSPRLVDLAFGVPEIDGLVLCPCCIKGGLGGACRSAARERNVPPYVVLCETLRALCEGEVEKRYESLAGDICHPTTEPSSDHPSVPNNHKPKRVTARADPNVDSPVNCFICAVKTGRLG